MHISRSRKRSAQRPKKQNRSRPYRIDSRPTICITMGYPAGIGPEVIARALASRKIRRLAFFLVIGDEFVFKKALKLSGKKLNYCSIDSEKDIDLQRSGIIFLDLKNTPRRKFTFGRISASYGRNSIDYINRAVSLAKAKKVDAIVTAPIHKLAAELSGFKHPGHTEYLARLTHTRDYAMMLTGGPLKVVLATTHLPLKDVSGRLVKVYLLAYSDQIAVVKEKEVQIR